MPQEPIQKMLSELKEGDEFKFPNGSNRYDVIGIEGFIYTYRQLTNYSNRPFKQNIEERDLKIIHLP